MRCLMLAAGVCSIVQGAHLSSRDIVLEVSAGGSLQGAVPTGLGVDPMSPRSPVLGAIDAGAAGATGIRQSPASEHDALVSLTVFSDGSSLRDTDLSVPEEHAAIGDLPSKSEPPLSSPKGRRPPSRISKEESWHTGPVAHVSDSAQPVGRREVPLAILLVALVLFLCGSTCVMIQLGSQLVELVVSSKGRAATNEEAWAKLAAEGSKLGAGPPLSRMPGE
mmetsp:Transcript_771/g.1821  ORF Transcript_771/g.1821 Transcript_771/m.1821 type:complete len:221 (+) Transcript_771:41-703(+)